MTTPTSARSQYRTMGFAVFMLLLTVLMLAFAWTALGEEILTMPENRKEAIEIKAQLKALRAERDSLITEISELKVQVETNKAEAEKVTTLVQKLEILQAEVTGAQAEVTRARAERDRLSKETTALASDVAVRQDSVNMLTEQKSELMNEIELFTNRVQDSRIHFEEAKQELNARQKELVIINDEIATRRKVRDQVKNELSNLEQTLATKSNILNELVAEEQTIKHRIDRLKIRSDELSASITSEQNQLVKVHAEIDSAHIELEHLRKERDSTKNELDRAKAVLDTTNTQKEATAVTLENLIRHEAQIRQQLRSMIDQLIEAGLIDNATVATES